MKPLSFSKSLTAASANCICQSQSVAAGANAVINGGSATAGAFTLDTERRIAIVSAGNDSANTAHIYGNRSGGQPINEILALTNAGTAVSVLDYMSGGTITFTSATASTVTVGTNATGSSRWHVPNYNLTPFSLDVQTELTGSVTWNFETTNDPNFWDPPRGTGYTTPQPNVNEVLQASTIAQGVTLAAPVSGWRVTITANTGTLSVQGVQAGIFNG
jgi:hypothetical protein